MNFNKLPQIQGVERALDNIPLLPEGEPLRAQVKEELIRRERFIGEKFRRFIVEHLPGEFWSISDELYKHPPVFPPITTSTLWACLGKVYGARSDYVHGGEPFPAYVDFGLRGEVPAERSLQLEKLRDKEKYLPPFAWFERVTHLAIVEYMRRSFAPELVRRQQEDLVEKEHLLRVMAELPTNVQNSLRKLAQWTARLLGAAITNPHAPNKDWADSARTVKALLETGLIGTKGRGLQGSSWLKSRAVGEAVGEFVFGPEANPFRGNVLLRRDPPHQK
jgi:hypothetical protein